MRKLFAVALLLAAVVAAPAAASKPEAKPEAKLSLTDRFPTVGKATTILVPPGADEVKVVYSPGSRVERTDTIAVPKLTRPPQGRPYQVVWRPARPGVVQLSAAGQSIKVSVRFEGVPSSGIGIMLFAGLILFGGAAVSLRALLREE